MRGREEGKPILVLASDLGMVTPGRARMPPLARRLADGFWPGALTLVLPARDGLPAALTARQRNDRRARARPRDGARPRGGARTAGDRAVGEPAGQRRPRRRSTQARAYFGAHVDAYVDGGRCDGAPSTVVKIDGDAFTVLREGRIDAASIRRAAEE